MDVIVPYSSTRSTVPDAGAGTKAEFAAFDGSIYSVPLDVKRAVLCVEVRGDASGVTAIETGHAVERIAFSFDVDTTAEDGEVFQADEMALLEVYSQTTAAHLDLSVGGSRTSRQLNVERFG